MAEASQLAEYGRALRAELVARGVPFVVTDGPEPTGATKYTDRMVLENREGGDSFSRTGTRKGNPPILFTRSVAARPSDVAGRPTGSGTPIEDRRVADSGSWTTQSRPPSARASRTGATTAADPSRRVTGTSASPASGTATSTRG